MKIGFGKAGVASDHYLASLAALEILREGGNAFDAALAVSAVLSVVQPQTSGLGGDGFLLAVLENEEIIVYNGSGRSPKNFPVDSYLAKKPLRGLLTITMPGLIDLWGFIYENYATLDMERILRPAISLALNGFHIGVSLARSIAQLEKELSREPEYKNWFDLYSGHREGDFFTNKDLGVILRRIAIRGWDEFYYGETAEEIVLELQKLGLDIGLDDFMEHKGYIDKPLKLDLETQILHEIPPNTQGISTLQMIDALYSEELNKYDFEDPLRIIRWSEPVKKIYNFRDNHIGDINYMNIDPNRYVRYKDVKRLDLDRKDPYLRSGGDTTFFVVGDHHGNIVGFIQSLFYPFGSGVVAKGIVFQNRGAGFSYTRDKPNSPAPQKRPLHTLSILMVRDYGKDSVHMIGCAGGHWRPQIHTRIYENIFVYSMSLDQAIEAPRFIYDYSEHSYEINRLLIENYLRPPDKTEYLIHYMKKLGGTGLVNILRRDLKRGLVSVASDPRSEGVALSLN